MLSFVRHLLIFFKINICKNSLRNTIKVLKGLDHDQAHHFVRHALDLNCLQMKKSPLAEKEFNP